MQKKDNPEESNPSAHLPTYPEPHAQEEGKEDEYDVEIGGEDFDMAEFEKEFLNAHRQLDLQAQGQVFTLTEKQQ